MVVFDSVSTVVIKYYDQTQHGEERVYVCLQLLHSIPSVTEVVVGTWSQELKQEPQGSPAYRLVLHSSLSLLYYSTLEYPLRVGTAHSRIDSPSIISEGYRPMWYRHFSPAILSSKMTLPSFKLKSLTSTMVLWEI